MNRKRPELLADLYRDFRDRSLLIPAGLLVVALIAVPVLMSTSPSPPPAAPQTAAIDATAATPAVLAEDVGIRNYRKRLNQLKRKNPFNQQFTQPIGPDLLGLGLGDVGSAPGGGLDAGGAGGDPVGLDAGDIDGDAGQPAGSPPSAGREPAQGSAPAKGSKPPEDRWFTWEVDLAFGPVREAERFEGVRLMDFLPSRKEAVAVMAGVGLRGNRVGFMLLPTLTGSKGDGKCAPGPRNCSFLMLGKGKQHRVTVVGPDGNEVIYRIKVHDVVPAELKPGDFDLPGDE